MRIEPAPDAHEWLVLERDDRIGETVLAKVRARWPDKPPGLPMRLRLRVFNGVFGAR
jgi:hypothetical protein